MHSPVCRMTNDSTRQLSGIFWSSTFKIELPYGSDAQKCLETGYRMNLYVMSVSYIKPLLKH